MLMLLCYMTHLAGNATLMLQMIHTPLAHELVTNEAEMYDITQALAVLICL
jgi:hypothetical protein